MASNKKRKRIVLPESSSESESEELKYVRKDLTTEEKFIHKTSSSRMKRPQPKRVREDGNDSNDEKDVNENVVNGDKDSDEDLDEKRPMKRKPSDRESSSDASENDVPLAVRKTNDCCRTDAWEDGVDGKGQNKDRRSLPSPKKQPGRCKIKNEDEASASEDESCQESQSSSDENNAPCVDDTENSDKEAHSDKEDDSDSSGYKVEETKGSRKMPICSDADSDAGCVEEEEIAEVPPSSRRNSRKTATRKKGKGRTGGRSSSDKDSSNSSDDEDGDIDDDRKGSFKQEKKGKPCKSRKRQSTPENKKNSSKAVSPKLIVRDLEDDSSDDKQHLSTSSSSDSDEPLSKIRLSPARKSSKAASNSTLDSVSLQNNKDKEGTGRSKKKDHTRDKKLNSTSQKYQQKTSKFKGSLRMTNSESENNKKQRPEKRTKFGKAKMVSRCSARDSACNNSSDSSFDSNDGSESDNEPLSTKKMSSQLKSSERNKTFSKKKMDNHQDSSSEGESDAAKTNIKSRVRKEKSSKATKKTGETSDKGEGKQSLKTKGKKEGKAKKDGVQKKKRRDTSEEGSDEDKRKAKKREAGSDSDSSSFDDGLSISSLSPNDDEKENGENSKQVVKKEKGKRDGKGDAKKRRNSTSGKKGSVGSGGRSKSSSQKDGKRLELFKRFTRLSGLRIAYVKVFADAEDDDEKIAILLNLLRDAGLKGKPTLKSCRKLKERRDELAELAALDAENIIEENSRTGRSRRRNVFSCYLKESPGARHQSDPSPDRITPVDHFANLRGIISDDSDSE